ncbi:MAG: PHP domain-containing protein, partial [Bryobacterales bacterium]|nr:PHP domain-containing protein [Bryobacterales bacterium]
AVIDLHSHTNESDGTFTPLELVDLATKRGIEALAISDHDTFAGFDQALPEAQSRGLDLVCGIELSTRLHSNGIRTVHLLAYFLQQPPPTNFRAWLDELIEGRRDRNRRLIDSLRQQGIDIDLGEVERLGRTLTGRPHFARLLMQKGYVASFDEAFRRYLGESAPTYVERFAPYVELAIQRVIDAGGLPVLAHPIRLGFRDFTAEEKFIGDLRDAGLRGIEVFHSDHGPRDMKRYAGIARKYNLAVSGGSDFHGDVKPQISLGTGNKGNLNIPKSVLERLRAASG